MEGGSVAKKRNTGFGKRLRELRLAAGLTQGQLAERAGMHLFGITKLEQGYREPAWSTVLDLARALSVDVNTFAEADQQPPTAAAPKPRGRPSKPKRADTAEGPPPGKKKPQRKKVQ